MADFDQQMSVGRECRLRGIVLELVNTNHKQQRAHMDGIMLWGLLDTVGFSVGQADVLTVVQDLADRNYLVCEQSKNRWTGRTQISKIGITPAGRDLVEQRTKEDKAVLIP
jgi:hypothetical protein